MLFVYLQNRYMRVKSGVLGNLVLHLLIETLFIHRFDIRTPLNKRRIVPICSRPVAIISGYTLREDALVTQQIDTDDESIYEDRKHTPRVKLLSRVSNCVSILAIAETSSSVKTRNVGLIYMAAHTNWRKLERSYWPQ